MHILQGPPWAYSLVGMTEGPPNLPTPHPHLPSRMPIATWMDVWFEGHGSTQTEPHRTESTRPESSGSGYQLSGAGYRTDSPDPGESQYNGSHTKSRAATKSHATTESHATAESHITAKSCATAKSRTLCAFTSRTPPASSGPPSPPSHTFSD